MKLTLRISIGIAAIATLVAGAGFALRAWLPTEGGRALLVSLLDGRRIGALGTLRISGLKGDPLTGFTLAEIDLVDDEGIWLEAHNLVIAWRPLDLLSQELDIESLQLREVDILRRPNVQPRPRTNARESEMAIRIGHAAIEELVVSAGVLGPRASFRFDGEANLDRNWAGKARVDVKTTGGPGDTLSAEGEWSLDGAIDLALSASGPANGILATLFQAPEGERVEASVAAGGTIERFVTDANLRFSDRTVAALKVTRNDGAAVLGGRIETTDWPLMDDAARRAGAFIELAGTADLAHPYRAPMRIAATTPAGRIDLSALVDLRRFAVEGLLQIAITDYDLSFLPELGGRLNASGQARIESASTWTWEGTATASNFSFPGGAVRSVSGPIVLSRNGPNIRWSLTEGSAEGAALKALPELAAGSYLLSTLGGYDMAVRRVAILEAQLSGLQGRVTGKGAYGLAAGDFSFEGLADAAELKGIATFRGKANGEWRVDRRARDAPLRIGIRASGRGIDSSNDALAQLLGSEPRVEAALVSHRGRLLLESGALSGGALEARMTGSLPGEGAIRARAKGKLVRPIQTGQLRVEALDFSADISGDLARPRLDLNVLDGGLTLAGQGVQALKGSLKSTLDSRGAGNFWLAGRSDGQPLSLRGGVARRNGSIQISAATLEVGGLATRIERLEMGADAVRGAIQTEGSLAGLAGFDRGRLGAQGEFSWTSNSLDLNFTGSLQDAVQGKVAIETAAFDVRSKNGEAAGAARIRLAEAGLLDATLTADARRSGDIWSGSLALKGTAAGQPIASATPIAWNYSGGNATFDGAVNAFGGRIAAVVSTGKMASARVDLAGVDLADLSVLFGEGAASGELSGSLQYAKPIGEDASGDASLAFTNVNPKGVRANPVFVSIAGQLRKDAVALRINGAGQGFRLEAEGAGLVEIGEGFALRPALDKPWRGRGQLNGATEHLWALFGPSGHDLRAEVSAELTLGGTPSSPGIEGMLQLKNGNYQQETTGLSLRDMVLAATFDRNTVAITGFSASDGAGGALTGGGRLDWNGDLAGELAFRATRLRILNRDDRTAVVSGSGQLATAKGAFQAKGQLAVDQARLSVEQPASARIPVLAGLRRVNFPDEVAPARPNAPSRPLSLDIRLTAPRRVFVFGRGLDTEWGADLRITGTTAQPRFNGQANLQRGDLNMAGRRFGFEGGTIFFDGPVNATRINLAAAREAADIDARVAVTGTPAELKFELSSTPALPQDEVLSRVLFSRSASQLSGLETAQLAAALNQLAGGQAAFDPAELLRGAAGLDRLAIGTAGDQGAVSAGKYLTRDVYLEVGAGGEGGVAAEVEWQPADEVSIISSARGNGDTRIALRWKKDY